MINIVVTCTKKKRKGPEYPLYPELKLGSIHGNLNLRFNRWIEAIEKVDAPGVSAKNLYVGDHWSVARSLNQPTSDIKLWVCSAGYGLITPESRIKPYSATFSMHNFDSVGSSTEDNQTWWGMLNAYRGEEFCAISQPRSIEEIASADPGSQILVIASKNYLNAIQKDVLKAISTLTEPSNLAIISAGTRVSKEFIEHLVECDARFSHIVKGALRSLNVRIARELLFQPIVLDTLATGGDLMSALKFGITKIAPNGLPDLIRYSDREPQTDEQIKAFISDRLDHEPTSTFTKLLKELRLVNKKQCEQRRFSNLFHHVQSERV